MKSFSAPKLPKSIDLKRKATGLLATIPGQARGVSAQAPVVTSEPEQVNDEATTTTEEPESIEVKETTDTLNKLSLGLLRSSSIPKSPPPAAVELESVYIVLRPLELNKAPEHHLKQLGKVVKAIQFEEYLLLQHWGVLVGKQYYHLHLDDKTKALSVSMVPFQAFDPQKRDYTIKFPIWRTALTHDERVGIAVGIIKSMGNFKTETEIEIHDEDDKLVIDVPTRTRYTMEGRYKSWPLLSLPKTKLFSGKYDPLTNNCIHFTKNFIFDQLLQRQGELGRIPENVKWLVDKWIDMGCRRSPKELYTFLAGVLGVANPFNMTPERGARVIIKLLSIYLDIDWHTSVEGADVGDKLGQTEREHEEPKPVPVVTVATA